MTKKKASTQEEAREAIRRYLTDVLEGVQLKHLYEDDVVDDDFDEDDANRILEELRDPLIKALTR
jgi:hypothetical protein